MDLLNRYSGIDDPDLQYMALRELTSDTLADMEEPIMTKLVTSIFIPALSGNDLPIANLVSLELLPTVAQFHKDLAARGIIQPLSMVLQGDWSFQDERTSRLLVTLNNVLQRLSGKIPGCGVTEKYAQFVIALPHRTYLSWEVLRRLLETQDSDHVTDLTFGELYRLAIEDVRVAGFEALRIASGSVHSHVVAKAVNANPLEAGHLKLLTHVSLTSHSFRTCYAPVLETLMENIHEFSLGDSLLVIQNLMVWLRQSRIEDNPQAKEILRQKILSVCVNLVAGEDDQDMTFSDQEIDFESDEDIPDFSDEEYASVDDEEMKTSDFAVKVLQILPLTLTDAQIHLVIQSRASRNALADFVRGRKIGYELLAKKFPDEKDPEIIDEMPLDALRCLLLSPVVQKRIDFLRGPSVVSEDDSLETIQTVLLAREQLEGVSKTQILQSIARSLDSESSSLMDFQVALDTLLLATKLQAFENYQDQMLEIVLPQLKPNKNFVKTLKAGNLKQTIDDGSVLRLSCYTLIKHLKPSYEKTLQILDACIDRGFKDEVNVKDAALEVFMQFFQRTWSELRIRDSSWFQIEIIPKIRERIEKNATQLRATATSQQLADSERSLRGVGRLTQFLDPYVRIVRDDFAT
ncbi:LAMI_0E06282g1_1 [Lachancea mirantina]|uniref:LAMI_0E06282g1_1 n=1 Tax=Lachancea mirantina TaxID=1230905 RepID=A0A1G4JLS4_9SACH|nr:LAMI_0E06282g1_1 [Lachancea mirantina]